jgi:hypothetical protein
MAAAITGTNLVCLAYSSRKHLVRLVSLVSCVFDVKSNGIEK